MSQAGQLMPWQLPQQPAPGNKDSSLCVVAVDPVCLVRVQQAEQKANMPAKKKTKKATKKKPGKIENELEEQRRPSLLDVVVLQDHVALQRESLIRVQADRSDLRRCLRNMEQKLQHEIQDRRDISSALCQEELRKEKREREELEEEKDAAICDLQLKLDNMETDYEKILHETLDSLTSQLSVARQGWEDRSTSLHENYKQALSEFGLNALDV
ncbi:coiled-coil domain-containing protein 153 isoform X3 [Betta splendens]|uniref:Dynein regulatory complex protein 12 n=1 Tax=Betta splendens TaxID=158456 RepID=A0A9W2Y842_BETSP|nr:coiled-coil domain-containing protein 153 isoform X3 [Betta splendens]